MASEILMEVFGTDNGNIVVPKKPRISLKGMIIYYAIVVEMMNYGKLFQLKVYLLQ